ncbi:hypothetical protein J7E62_21155 [Variovorax paradoxus]|nr:hypothetical protein [Variovorax paradoxus]
MSMDLLQQIAASRLPLTFHRAEDIDKIRVLRAAGLVIAMVPSPSDPLNFGGTATAAQVLAVTRKGREELSSFSYPDEQRPASRGSRPWLSAKIAAMAGKRSKGASGQRNAEGP